MARQDPRYRGPEEGKDAKRTYSIEAWTQLRWTGHVTTMPDERLPKKVLYGEPQEGKRSQGGQKKRYKDTLKASLKDFNIPTESWEQAAQDRTKWRCLIKKGASQFEAKRICEAERKRKERKAIAKGPSSDSAQSEFTCSICNRQFRAKIGLYSNQRAHKHTKTPNIQDLRWSFSVMRDEQSLQLLIILDFLALHRINMF